MPEINISPATSMSQVLSALKDAKDSDELRINADDQRLHTKSSKLGGLGQDAKARREAKFQKAVDTLTDLINNKCGKNVGTSLMQKFGIDSKITVQQLKQVNQAIHIEQGLLKNEMTQACSPYINDIQSKILDGYAALNDVAADLSTSESTVDDPFRTNGGTVNTLNIITDIAEDQDVLDNLSLQECAYAVLPIMQKTPVFSSRNLVSLLNNYDVIQQAVGDLTGLNTLQQTLVSFDASEQDIQAFGEEYALMAAQRNRDSSMELGGEALASLIHQTLSAEELSDFKSRVEFLRDLSALQLEKIGFCIDQDDSDLLKVQQWYKSNAVNSSSFLGFDNLTTANSADLTLTEMSVVARDLLTAAAIHFDLIFE